MEWTRGTEALTRELIRPVLTIGNFDGVHLGHRAIMETIVERARAHDGEAVVYTFEPHPRKVLQPRTAPPLLTTVEQKQELLSELGVDVVIAEPFDEQFANVSPGVFVREYVHARIAPVEVYVGYDFHFGRDREGSMRSLTESGPQLGFSVTIIPEVKVGGRDVNSTRIRELLAGGAVEDTRLLLGRPYSLRGKVVAGSRRGRTLGFATANVVPENEVVPAHGVYAGRMRLLDDGDPGRGAVLDAVVNVGLRPTFEDGQGLLVEAHALDFSGDVYDRRVDVSFEHRLRAEQKFEAVDALKAQIGVDAEEARRRLSSS